MRENSNVTNGLTIGIMGKKWDWGTNRWLPCQSINCMVDLAETDSTSEGMGTIWLEAKWATQDEQYTNMDGILWHDIMGHEIDTKNVRVTHRGCYEWVNDAATQNRPSGDHENMSKRWNMVWWVLRGGVSQSTSVSLWWNSILRGDKVTFLRKKDS